MISFRNCMDEANSNYYNYNSINNYGNDHINNKTRRTTGTRLWQRSCFVWHLNSTCRGRYQKNSDRKPHDLLQVKQRPLEPRGPDCISKVGLDDIAGRGCDILRKMDWTILLDEDVIYLQRWTGQYYWKRMWYIYKDGLDDITGWGCDIFIKRDWMILLDEDVILTRVWHLWTTVWNFQM